MSGWGQDGVWTQGWTHDGKRALVWHQQDGSHWVWLWTGMDTQAWALQTAPSDRESGAMPESAPLELRVWAGQRLGRDEAEKILSGLARDLSRKPRPGTP